MNANKIPRNELNNKRYLKIEDAARVSGLSTYFIRNAVKAGQLPHIKSGRVVYLDMEKFNGALEALTR